MRAGRCEEKSQIDGLEYDLDSRDGKAQPGVVVPGRIVGTCRECCG
jgi:hypothetical protein